VWGHWGEVEGEARILRYGREPGKDDKRRWRSQVEGVGWDTLVSGSGRREGGRREWS
jgi:hypothetical protein